MSRCCSLLVVACGGHSSPPAAQETLNIYNWTDFIAPDTVANFERETGIKVLYDTYESDEVLETKLLTGHTNYDIVVPSDIFFERLIKAGALRKLDKAALPNSVNLDPEAMRELAVHDPGNLYGIPYTWYTIGIGYNVDKVRERLGSSQPDSWSLLFDPKNAAKLQDCGISMVDSPTDVLSSVLIYLGKDPNSRDMADLNVAKIRPFVRTVVSVGNIVDLTNGTVCVVLGWGSDMVLARDRALEAGNGVKIRFIIPREGGLVGNDVLAIAAGAPHPKNAEKWLNYLMRPKVSADITNAIKYPNGNRPHCLSFRMRSRTIRHSIQTPKREPDCTRLGRCHQTLLAW